MIGRARSRSTDGPGKLRGINRRLVLNNIIKRSQWGSIELEAVQAKKEIEARRRGDERKRERVPERKQRKEAEKEGVAVTVPALFIWSKTEYRVTAMYGESSNSSNWE